MCCPMSTIGESYRTKTVLIMPNLLNETNVTFNTAIELHIIKYLFSAIHSLTSAKLPYLWPKNL